MAWSLCDARITFHSALKFFPLKFVGVCNGVKSGAPIDKYVANVACPIVAKTSLGAAAVLYRPLNA